MFARQKSVRVALYDTCDWLFSSQEYLDWISRRNIAEHHGLLWIQGKPGAGKSTLMKQAFLKTRDIHTGTIATTAAFFFNARGSEQLGKSALGLFRALLHQALQQDRHALSLFIPEYLRRSSIERAGDWHREDLQNMLYQTFACNGSRPAFLFIDALDECDDSEIQELVDFLRDLTTTAFECGARLHVCFTSRHYSKISIERCLEVVVEDHNKMDILRYIRAEAIHMNIISHVQQKLLDKSQGIFLWVVLVIAMIKRHARGKSLKWIQKQIDELPAELEQLFLTLFDNISYEDARRLCALVQWILFAAEWPSPLSEFHCAQAFAAPSRYVSLRAWENSDEWLLPSERESMIVITSRGLVEVVRTKDSRYRENYILDYGFPVCQFIHETVRQFFLYGIGCKLLEPAPDGSVVIQGHRSIAWACVNYLQTEEMRKLLNVASESSQSRSEQMPNIEKDTLNLLHYIVGNLFEHIKAAEFDESETESLLYQLELNEVILRRCWRLVTQPRRATVVVAGELYAGNGRSSSDG
ncbi:MAG: hypothetical protein Q9165_003369 [Trypethelium subeluteriae]